MVQVVALNKASKSHKPIAQILFGATPVVTLKFSNGNEFKYDITRERIKLGQAMVYWRELYDLQFPADDSFTVFWDLFKNNL